MRGRHIYITSMGEKYLFQKNKCLKERPVLAKRVLGLSGRLRSLSVVAEAVEEPLSFNRLVAMPPSSRLLKNWPFCRR